MKVSKLVKLSVVFFGISGNAIAAPEYQFYSASGQKIDAKNALSVALKNETLLRCQQVIAVPNASGTSVSLRIKK